MGRRKWKLYQDGLLPRRAERGDRSSGEESIPTSDGPPPSLKIKTIEQINAPEDGRPKIEEGNGTDSEEPKPARTETILESLIRKPATQPKVEYQEEPVDWKPADNKCHFCEDGDRNDADGEQTRAVGGGATSPASESDSSSISGAKSPAAPPLLQHLLQIQAQNPQAIAQFQQMMATLAALGSGLVPPALSQAWLMQRLVQSRQTDRLPETNDKAPASAASPAGTAEQPLDLSAKSNSTSGSPPPGKGNDTNRSKNNILDAGNSSARRAYTEDELQSALRDIQAGRLGTRRAAVVYGIPRSTLRNKVYKMASDPNADSEPDSDNERDRESPPSVILKIPTFPPPDEKSQSPAATLPPHLTAPPQPTLNPPAPLLLPSTVFADPPASQHLFTSLSNVIAKSISQKFQQPQPELNFMRAPERHVSVIKTPPEGQRNMGLPSNSRQMSNNNGQPQPGGKGTRPKRGKYRNYDRDSLVEAVKAVQRGEMSVHRAGSYYGVPHSTLEYKVKERHLMRPRKREPKPQQDVKPQPPKPPPPKPATKPFTNGLNGPEGAYPGGYGFWPGSYAPPPPTSDLYASHMMRRLREEAPPPSANGSFLEGIIRSTLERPGAALLQRLTAPPADALRRPAERELSPPAARRPRLDSSDSALAAEMREAVNRLRADKLRPRNGTPTPPAAASPPPAPPDRL